MAQTEVKINEWLVEGAEIFKNHLGLLSVASLTALFFSVLTLGILAGPMTAGLIRIILAFYDRDERPPQIRDIFKGFSYFKPAFLFSCLWCLTIGLIYILQRFIPFSIIWQALSMILYLGVSIFLMFGLYIIVDRNQGFRAAAKESIKMVRSNAGAFLKFGAMVTVIGSIGVLFCVVGTIFTLPLALCILAVAYREVFSGIVTERAALVTDEKPPIEGLKHSGASEEIEPVVYEVTDQEIKEITRQETAPQKPKDG